MLFATIPALAEAVDIANITPSDFAIEVNGLPRNLGSEEDHKAYEAKLRAHFETLFTESTAATEKSCWRCCFRRPKTIPADMGVPEISLVRDLRGKVFNYKKQADLLKKIKIEEEKRDNSIGPDNKKKLEKLEEKKKKM